MNERKMILAALLGLAATGASLCAAEGEGAPAAAEQPAAPAPAQTVTDEDGNIITGKGPGAAFEFGYTIVEYFRGQSVSQILREGMIYEELING